jgi:hypothetical protein
MLNVSNKGDTMRDLKREGFYIEHTGGNCTAWVKKLETGQFVVITDASGCTHEVKNGHMIGIYDGSEGDLWGDLITSFVI